MLDDIIPASDKKMKELQDALISLTTRLDTRTTVYPKDYLSDFHRILILFGEAMNMINDHAKYMKYLKEEIEKLQTQKS